MKTIKVWMALAIFSTVFASCLGDDPDDSVKINYKELTKEEQKAIHQKLGGEYETYFFFTNADTQKTDSTLTKWVVNPVDSTATCTDFPVDILGNYVKSNNIKEALKQVGRQPVSFKYITDPIVVEDYYKAGIFYYPFSIKERVTLTPDVANPDNYAAIEFSTQFTFPSVIYTQMAVLDNDKFYGVLLVKTVEANHLSENINLLFPFQTPFKGKVENPDDNPAEE